MAVKYINENDTLNAGRVKINAAIEKATNAEISASQAMAVANDAKTQAQSTQTQLDNIIIENGQSDAEVVQARTKADGTTFPLLKDRLDASDELLSNNTKNIMKGEFIEADPFIYHGYNMQLGQNYTSDRANYLLNYAKNDIKMDAIALVPTWYMDTYTSNTIARNSTRTINDSVVIQTIRDAKAAGYKVMLKPHIDVLDGTWRGSISPTDRNAWFASYEDFIMTYAQIANNENVDIFCIGTELKSSTKPDYLSYWSNIISSIRNIYSGRLTYAATAMNTDNFEEYLVIPFWNLLDIAGLNVYFKLVSNNMMNPTIFDIACAWSNNSEGIDIIKKISDWQKSINMPVIFTEIGCTVYDGSTQNPGAYQQSGNIDLQEQADYVAAMFSVWTGFTEWMNGFFWWRLSFDSQDAFTFENRPSAQIFSDWITHIKRS